ncbi:2-hydroxychromene-2-carboxylate isomerase [Phenylobacterium sp. Root700]|uniref:2-hydroxychromene-2-carboxylate isomerase n=1 Tax=Phenylobacterium sp. Root700 TaxID=1736591 RepID=UPI0006FC4BAD|nr:2-hydroxychromene-2-carboxylate isomerase [Phenylobacterium sp. Root700]KRB40969.1 disulfide bond formation protein DsbA [Phenylobacterium sp. Root700]
MKVKFFFDFGSPNAYMCHRVIPQIEDATGVPFEYVPILLGGVFKLTGNQSPATAFAHIKNKPEYERLETDRFLRRHKLSDFRFNPHFPVNTLQLMRGAVAAQEAGVFEAFVKQVYDDMWLRGRRMDDPEVYAASLVEAGLPKDDILRLAQTDPVKSRLLANTEGAVDAGVFGSPSFLVGKELFFGKDRLRDVEEEITAAAATQPA